MALQARNYDPALAAGASIDVAVDLTDISDQNQNEVIEIDGTASAVNFVRVTNSATTVAPAISAQGDDTNVGLGLSSKGTGSVTIWSGDSARELLILANAASAINEVTITQAAAGSNASIIASGTDTSPGLDIAGKAGASATNPGGTVVITGGAGNTTGAGGLVSLTGGAGGNDAVGGSASLVGGAAGVGSGNRAGGAALVTGGAGQGTAAGGAVTATSGASENGTGVSPGASGAITLQVGAAGTATTGTAGAGGALNILGAAGGASTGASSTAGAGSDVSITAGAGGASSGGSDTGGAGGDVVVTAGAGGTGATAGVAGAIFERASSGANYFKKMAAPTAKTTSATLTAAEMLGGWITVNQGGGATSTQTTPTGTQLVAAFPASLAAGDCFDFYIVNISTVAAEDAILGFGTDITGVGNLTVNSNDAIGTQSQGCFRFRYSGSNVWVAYRIS